MEAPVPAQAVHQQRSRGDRRSYPPRTLQNQTGEAESSSPATTFRPHQQNYQQRRASGRGGPVRPAPTAPLAHSQLQATSAVEANTAGDTRLRASFTGVGRGRGRGEPRRGSAGRGRSLRQAHQQSHITGGAFQGRQFGGHLSSNDTSDIVQASSSPALQADAPDFVPGQAHATKTRTAGQQTPGKQRRYSKSMAPDIATRTHEDIEHGVYECPICTNEISRGSKIWSCRSCWTVFHLSCIKKWATNEGSALAQQQAQSDSPSPRQWRCPGCNLPKDAQPKAYNCWCEKEMEPRTITGLPPHSCGQTCGRARTVPKNCPHPCDLICHAGPCPPCSHMGPTQSCFCGKQSATRRCADTDYEKGWSCGEICGDLMPCGEHTCQRACHEGLCGACEVHVDARCYCGQVEKSILCCDRGDKKPSKRSYISKSGERITEDWSGQFECTNICNRQFDCGKHSCEKQCHSQTSEIAHCLRSPDVVTRCPCGKTMLDELLAKPRTSCEDPIPHCTKPCSKRLSCGHTCEQTCHLGNCMPCLRSVPITCRCGRTTSTSICHQGSIEPPQCMRVCKATLNCGRHSCDERCCTGERKAAERQSTKRKPRHLDSALPPAGYEFEAEHICTRLCGRTLKCGNHTCQDLCHKGPCPSCREAIFDEIPCACGRTVLQPPLPCGTQPPPCRYQCERSKSCGHPQVVHTCHQDGEACPKCPFLTSKVCLCGKKTLKNQQCWLPSVRCGEICGNKLKCGSHTCRKPCHAPGECEDAGISSRTCQQPCGKPKSSCGHPCEDACHAPFPCREDKPCIHKTLITCPCQRQKQEVRCNASKSDPEGNRKKELKCDDECARLERNRKLALALNIDQETHTDDHVPYSVETLRLYQELGVQWAQQQEREFRVFAIAEDEKRLRFKPMTAGQRRFLHVLAEDFGIDSESMDPEPHRHVFLYKTPRFVSAPNKTVGECIRIRGRQRMDGKSTPANEDLPRKETSNLVGDPFNGFLLTNPRFGLTIDELRTTVENALPAGFLPHLDINFLPSDEVALRTRMEAVPQGRTIAAERESEVVLKNAKLTAATAVSAKGLGKLQLCRVDDSLNVTRREADEAPTGSAGGWSQVAAKGASRRDVKPTTAPVQGRNGFEILGQGNKVVFEKKKDKKQKPKKQAVEVADDWEKAMSEEEEREKIASQIGSGDERATESEGDPGKTGDDREQAGDDAAPASPVIL